MGDFGTEFGNIGINVGMSVATKSVDLVIKLMAAIYKLWEDAPERKLKKEKLVSVKSDTKKKELINKIDGASGYIAWKKLDKYAHLTGRDLVATSLALNEKEFEDLQRNSAKCGIRISAIKQNIGDNTIYHVACIDRDLPRLKDMIDRMNVEKRLEIINTKIKTLESKEASLNDSEYKTLVELREERNNIIKQYDHSFNEQISKDIQSDPKKEIRNFNEAIDRNTLNVGNAERTIYIADATNPLLYMMCKSELSEFEGKKYVKTDYEVYKNNQKINEYSDARFDGRPADFWINLRAEIKRDNGFSDNVLIFESQHDYLDYVHKYTEMERDTGRGKTHDFGGEELENNFDSPLKVNTVLQDKNYDSENCSFTCNISGNNYTVQMEGEGGIEGIYDEKRQRVLPTNVSQSDMAYISEQTQYIALLLERKKMLEEVESIKGKLSFVNDMEVHDEKNIAEKEALNERITALQIPLQANQSKIITIENTYAVGATVYRTEFEIILEHQRKRIQDGLGQLTLPRNIKNIYEKLDAELRYSTDTLKNIKVTASELVKINAELQADKLLGIKGVKGHLKELEERIERESQNLYQMIDKLNNSIDTSERLWESECVEMQQIERSLEHGEKAQYTREEYQQMISETENSDISSTASLHHIHSSEKGLDLETNDR